MMRAKRPEESWAEYAAATGQAVDPVTYPKDPNRSGPGPGDHVSVESPTPQHDQDPKVPPVTNQARRAGKSETTMAAHLEKGPITPPVQEPPQQKPDPREKR